MLEPLRASGAALHVDHARPAVEQPQRRGRATATSCSTRAPRTTGGRRDNLLTSIGAAGRLKQLADELTHQYRVTYARPQSLIPPERVTVAAAQAGADGARHARQRTSRDARDAFSAPAASVASSLARRRRRSRASPLGARRRQQPPAQPPAAAAGAVVPRRRRSRLAERHGHRRHGALRHRPASRTTSGLRGRRQAGGHVLQPHQPADRARAAARHQRQHGSAAADRAGSGDRLRPAAAAAGSRRGRRLRQPRRSSCRRSPTTSRELEQAIRKTSAGGSTSLYNAIYIALKDLKKVVAKNADEIRRQAIVVLSDGEDTSSLLPFEEVLDLAKRPRRRSTRSACASDERLGATQGLQGSGVRAAAARAGNRRPRVLPEPDRRARRTSTARSPTSSRASTRSATPRRTRSATARGAASSSASTGRTLTARTKQGYFAPTALDAAAMNFVPLALYAAALVAYALALRAAAARSSAARRRRCSSPARSRTPSSSACRRWRSGTCRSPARRRRSRRSSGCWRSPISTPR